MKRVFKMILGIAAVMVWFGLKGGEPEPPAKGDSQVDFRNGLPKEIQKVLISSEKFMLYSINPEPVTGKTRWETFHEYRVLGKTPIADARQKIALVNTLSEGVAHADSFAKCFNPRHAIRATQGTNSIDLVVCFECRQVKAYSGRGDRWIIPTTDDPKKLFDEVLKRSGVPLAK